MLEISLHVHWDKELDLFGPMIYSKHKKKTGNRTYEQKNTIAISQSLPMWLPALFHALFKMTVK